MSNLTTTKIVTQQITGMGVGLFEVGAYRPLIDSSLPSGPEMLMRMWDTGTVLHSVNWLRFQNLEGRNIYIRPKGEHPLTLLDDLTIGSVGRMKAEGFQPAVVVETSPGNFQAWLNHGEVLGKEVSTRAAKMLASRFGADPSSADWRHFGRLAGFANRKEKHRNEHGLFPFVKLIEAGGFVYPAAKKFLVEVQAEGRREDQRREQVQRQKSGLRPAELRTIADFRRNPTYQNDGNRIDLAYSVYALSRGSTEDEVREAIAARDLTHKGSQKRQQDYIDRTVKKAWSRIRERSPER